MRVQAAILAVMLAACSETAEISVKRKPTPTPGASEMAASLADRLKSLLAGRNLPQMIHDAAEPFWQAAINPISKRSCPAGEYSSGEQRRICEDQKATDKRAADKPAVLEGAKVVKERLTTEAKARGDGDEQFMAYMSLEIDAKAKLTSAAGDWVNPEATPTPVPTPKPTPGPTPIGWGQAISASWIRVHGHECGGLAFGWASESSQASASAIMGGNNVGATVSYRLTWGSGSATGSVPLECPFYPPLSVATYSVSLESVLTGPGFCGGTGC